MKIHSTQRIEYVDIAKGVGMLFVIWGHIRLTGLGNAAIYAFHMPLFFFLSGMMYVPDKYTNLKSLVKRRIQKLLIPYFLFSIVTWLIWALYNMLMKNPVDSYWMPLLQTIISQGSGGYLVHNSPLWFITCLFVVEVLYFYTVKLPHWGNFSLCIILAILGNLAISDGSPLRYSPWSFDMALCAMPFYCIGNLISTKVGVKELSFRLNQHKWMTFLSVLFFAILLIFCARLNGPVSMGHRRLGDVYIFYPAACIGIFSIIGFSVLLTQFNFKLIEYVRWLGFYSFFAMSVHVPIKGVILVFMGKLIHKSVGELNASNIYSLIAFFITLVCVSISVWIISYGTNIYKQKRMIRAE